MLKERADARGIIFICPLFPPQDDAFSARRLALAWLQLPAMQLLSPTSRELYAAMFFCLAGPNE